MLTDVTTWARKNKYAGSTARKYALQMNLGQIIGVSRVLTMADQARLERALKANNIKKN